MAAVCDWGDVHRAPLQTTELCNGDLNWYYLHNANSIGKPNRKSRVNALTITPTIAGVRLPPRVRPLMLRISAATGAKNRSSPPRAAPGEPQLGGEIMNSNITAGPTNDSANPIVP